MMTARAERGCADDARFARGDVGRRCRGLRAPREHAGVVLDDLAGDRRGGDGERRGEVEPAGAGAALVVAVDGGDGDLVAALADAGATADAGAAAGLDDLDAGALE